MDQITHNIRRNNWLEIVRQCLSRPEGMSAKDWLDQNGVNRKTYYYWLRKFRKEAYAELPPAGKEQASTELSFAEIQLPAPIRSDQSLEVQRNLASVAVIKCNGITLEVSNEISESLLHKLIMEVSHA
ncbi:MAG: helix-turn-helix domain-containing protein [Butyrivibrio sp.]|nr:helix-turn-helix domain-containing protein [Butyrivibrio sp.]